MKKRFVCLLAVLASGFLPAAESFPVDFAAAANMGFADPVADDKQGGWSDQGPENDLAEFPTGEQTFAGLPFRISGCIALRGPKRPYFPEEVTVELPAPRTGKYLYILNATAWSSERKAGEVIVEYDRGDLVATETNTFTVNGGRETGNFWGAMPLPNAEIGWKGRNQSSVVGLYLTAFELSGRPIRRITFRSAGNMVWLIAGATLSNRQPRIAEPKATQEITAGKNWIPMPASFGVKPGSVLDFSHLQDAPAGKHGFVTTANGHFEFTGRPGKPIRFYGLNLVGDVHFMEKSEIDEIADELAASGYNLIRFHHFDNRMRVKGKPSTVIDDARRDHLDYWVAALKKRGIYVSLDLFTSRRPGKGEIADYPDKALNVDEYKALYPLSPGVRKNLEEFAADLLGHVNPYTNLAWKDEPAIAHLSLLNENSIYAVFDRTPFLREQYDRAFERWVKPGDTRDRNTLYDAFLLETYEGAYREMRAMTQRLGVKIPVSDQNFWMKVPLTILRDRYDYVDNHLYWSHPSYRNPKQRFLPPFIVENSNAVRLSGGTLPRRFPTKIYGKPFSMSEWNHCLPSAFNMQGVFLIGAYAGYQDWDSLCRFAYSHSAGNIRQRRPLQKAFDLACDPVAMLSDRIGVCFFLRGDVRPAVTQYPVLVEADPLKNGAPDYPVATERIGLVGGTGSIILHAGETPAIPRGTAAFLGLTPGRNQFQGKPVFQARENSLLRDLQRRNRLPAPAFEPDQLSYRSDTGELLLEGRRNRFSAVTPHSEGFLLDKNDNISGNFMAINNKYTYAGVFATAVDNRPLATSKRILLLHLPDHKGTGMRFRDSELSFLEDWGATPILLARGEVEATVNRELAGFRLYVLEGDGSRLGELPIRNSGGKSVFTLCSEWQGRGVIAYELVRE